MRGPGGAATSTRANGSSLLTIWIRGVAAAAFVGFAGNWNGPTVLVLAIAGGLSAFDLGRRDRRERGAETGFETDFYGPAMQVAFLVVLAAGAFDNRAPEATWRPPGLLGLCGLAVLLAGVLLRRNAARALGRHFTVGLSLLAHHELITTGPYRWLRHPNYAGLLLIAFGTAMMVWSPLALGVALVGWLPLALIRIRKEEHVLRERLGGTYDDYARDRWCLVPGVF